MPRRPDLSGENAPLADARRSRKAHLAAEKRVFADSAGVSNLHEVVDFYAAADACLADRCPIDRAAGLNLDIVFDHGGTCLAHFVPPAISLTRVTEPVAAYHYAILQNHAIADSAVLAYS